jgi:hypothetical protein
MATELISDTLKLSSNLDTNPERLIVKFIQIHYFNIAREKTVIIKSPFIDLKLPAFNAEQSFAPSPHIETQYPIEIKCSTN